MGATHLERKVTEHRAEIAGIEVFWREAPSDGAPTLYLHGNPSHSYDWMAFLGRCGGIAPDFPGWGRSAKPDDFDYSIRGFDRFVEDFCAHLGLKRFNLVVHDWGSVGLVLAQRSPERIERLVVFNSIVGLADYRWHYLARWFWRRRVIGELSMLTLNRRAAGLLSRQASARSSPMPEDWLEETFGHLDSGTRRGLLRLYRSAPEDVLAAYGRDLGRIDAPALVLWGDRDPYIGRRHGDFYARALANARVEHLAGAGHWPWIDRPELVERACRFLAGQD